MATILIIGSVAWDEVVHLSNPLRAGSHNAGRWGGCRIGGGAANTALALVGSGDRALVLSAVGDDKEGVRLVTELASHGVEIGLIDRHAGQTTRSLVMLDNRGERTVVNLARTAVCLPQTLVDVPADCCYVRSADPALTPVLAAWVRDRTVVAHVPPVHDGFRPAQVLLGSVSDLDASFLDDPFAAARRVAGTPLRWVVVTDGARGATAFGDGAVLTVAAPTVEVVDSTGAGDVFAAGLTHVLAAGGAMQKALETAVAWGTASVTYAGTVPPGLLAESLS